MSAGCGHSGCDHVEKALGRARGAGLRITKGLQAVLQLLHHERGQMGAPEIHARLRQMGESSGIPTVYRICDNLVAAGVLARQFAADGSMRYYLCLRCDSGHHHHFECRSCGKIFEIESCPVNAWAEQLQREMGFCVETHQLELRGLCSACDRGSAKTLPADCQRITI